MAVNARLQQEDFNISENSQNSELSFEEALAALEEIVGRLEGGSVPLDESISLYEKGEELRKQCQARLDAPVWSARENCHRP